MTDHIYWSYDDEGTHWQVYSDETSKTLPRWLPERIVRRYVWLLRKTTL